MWAVGDLPTLFLGREVNFTAVLPHLFLAHKQTAEHETSVTIPHSGLC